MNNSQFRKLVLDKPTTQSGSPESKNGLGATARRDGVTPSALGSRMRSSIPMTPRSIAGSGGIDFARQLAARNSSSQPSKKFRSTAAPKGVKLAAGYIDRTKERVSDEDDDKTARVKALEEMLKLQQIDQATFEKLRDEIVGGEIGSVHLVKGLDFRLLERVRRGEDVLSGGTKEEKEEQEDVDVEDEFDRLGEKKVVSLEKERTVKKGEMAPPELVPGKKRTRDQILAEMKAARAAAKEKAGPSLGSKFKKVGAPKLESRIERDGKGREVLITVDENGNEKRKVRRVQPEGPLANVSGLLMPDKDAKPLGMEVPEIPKLSAEVEEEDVDIFDDAGDDYDPLAGLEDEDEDDFDAEEGELQTNGQQDEEKTKPVEGEPPDTVSMPPPPLPKPSSGPRNYFNETLPSAAASTAVPGLTDPTILAALKKASSLTPITQSQSAEEAAKEARRQKMLEQDDRDAADMDIGFGSSRFGDEEDLGEEKIKLAKWGEDDDGSGEKGKGKGPRKRGPKKRKGDANSAADVLKVIEKRKTEGRQV